MSMDNFQALMELEEMVRYSPRLVMTLGPEKGNVSQVGPGKLVEVRAWEKWCKKWGREA